MKYFFFAHTYAKYNVWMLFFFLLHFSIWFMEIAHIFLCRNQKMHVIELFYIKLCNSFFFYSTNSYNFSSCEYISNEKLLFHKIEREKTTVKSIWFFKIKSYICTASIKSQKYMKFNFCTMFFARFHGSNSEINYQICIP